MHAGITSGEVIITASGTNNLQVTWWIDHKSVVLMYTVSCSRVSNTSITVKRNITFLVEGAINVVNIGQLLPSTRYNCCVIKHNVDNTSSEVCKEAVTLTNQGGEQTNSPTASGATISLFAMILITLLCILVLLVIIRKQGKDAKRIVNW